MPDETATAAPRPPSPQAPVPVAPALLAPAPQALLDRLATIEGMGQDRRLASLLPAAQLVLIPGGTHDLALEQADEIAPLIDRHLRLPQTLTAP